MSGLLVGFLACTDGAVLPDDSKGDAPARPGPTGIAVPASVGFEFESTSVVVPVEIDLAESLDGVWHDREFEQVVFAPRAQHRFTSGWYPARGGQKGPAFIESKGRSSSVELPVVDIADRLLVIDLAPFDAPGKLPEQVVRVVWNGHDLGRHVLGWQGSTLEVDVPARVQKLGLNRLRLEPLYWVSAAGAGFSFDNRPIGFKLTGLRLIGGRREASDQQGAVRIREEGLSLGAGAALGWYRLLPDAPRLVARVGWSGDEAPKAGFLRVAVDDEGGEQHVVFERALDDLSMADGEPVEIDLEAFAGTVVGIQLTVSSSAGDGTVLLQSPRLLGETRSRQVDTATAQGEYDVLVLLFDTLRADHLSPYGNEEVKTPNLEALAASGFTFTQAGSNASWTRPSAASLWTGLHPSAHGVITPVTPVPESAPYLPQMMQAAGWRTLAVSNNAHFSESFGFARGFDDMHPYFMERDEVLANASSVAAQADRIWSRFLAPAFDAAEETPVFAVVHEIDPHSPYQAPEPYASMYDFGYAGNIDGWNVHDLNQGMKIIDVINNKRPWLGEADRRQMQAQYKAEVSFVDAYIGAILERLEASGRRDRTLVVVVSDHGEQFFEHGDWGHGTSLYQEELAVPFMFSLPGVIPAGARSDEPVQLVDLAPTILELAGLAVPPGLQGRSLLPDMLAGPEEGAVPRGQFAMSNIRFLGRGGVMPSSLVFDSIRSGKWKLIRSTRRRMNVPQYEFELFDLERDPEEVLDLWPTHPVIGHALREELAAKLARDARIDFESEEVDELDPAVIENLRGLGYVE